MPGSFEQKTPLVKEVIQVIEQPCGMCPKEGADVKSFLLHMCYFCRGVPMDGEANPKVFECLVGGKGHKPLAPHVEGINTKFSVGFIIV
eukprot:880250-Rhodomonas_salina.1